MKSLTPNTLLQNRYLIVQLIGKGGMGEVYLAVDQRLGSAVALKRTFFSDEEALGNAFEREAKMLARLRHPALTKVSDHFTENGMQYLVMEHISGDDLAKRLEENQKPFPLSWVLFWADQLLDALSYLHSHEPPIIHRDIKPQNLKLTNENHIILLDFGLAKNSVGETRLSTTGDVVAYTPHYASMEQIRGTGTTARSDIYSLCATMYQLLSNIVPPDALSRADEVLNSQPDPVKPLHEINSEVPVGIANIIAKGMSLSAEQRFANAKEMQMALREAYAQSQKKMTAETVAFNTNEVQNLPTPDIKQSEIKTEVFSVPGVSQPIGEKTEVMPINLDTAQPEKITTNINLAEAPVNLDATIPLITPVITNEAVSSPLVGEKTEVMPFDLSPSVAEKTEITPIDPFPLYGEKTEILPADSSPDFGIKTVISPIDYSFPTNGNIDISDDKKTTNIPVDYSFPTDEKTEVTPVDIFSPVSEQTEIFPNIVEVAPQTREDIPVAEEYQDQNSFRPESTVPLVNLGEDVSPLPLHETANFVAPPIENFPQTENFQPEEVSEPISEPIKEEIKPEPKKKAAGGGGKVFIILGVLALLGFLGIGVAGIGLYVFKPELFGLSAPTPTPQPTVEPTVQPTTQPTFEPTVTPTAQPTLETNINTGNNSDLTNTNTETGNTNTVDNKTVVGDKTPRPQVDKTVEPVKQNTPVRQNTPPVKQNTPPVKQNTPPPAKTPPPSKKIEQ